MSKKANQKQKTSPATIDVNHSPKSGDQHRIRWRIACIAPAITVLLASFLFPANRIHEDEIYWIGSSYYYQLAVVEGDASNPDWQLLPARENPVLGKYVIGLALQIAGHPVTTPDLLGSFYLIFADVPGAWGTGEAIEKRLAVATRVTPSMRDPIRSGQALPLDDAQLATTRRTSLIFGMLAAIGIAVIGQQCKWRAGGLIAGVLFSLHPIAIESCSLAMIDIIAIAFSIWFMVGIMHILCLTANLTVDCKQKATVKTKHQASNKRQPGENTDSDAITRPTNRNSRQLLQRASMTLFTAIMLAFACGSKMNSLVVAATAAVCGAWYVGKLLHQRVKTYRSSQNHKPTEESGLRSPSANLVALSNQVSMLLIVAVIAVFVFIGSNPTLYGDPIDGVMALSYEHTLTADIQEVILGGRLNSVTERLQALAALVCGGPVAFTILCLIVTWAGYECIRNRSVGIVIVLWWSIALLLLIIWMPFAWERYTLPIIPPTMLILGAVTERAGCWLWSKLSSANRHWASTSES